MAATQLDLFGEVVAAEVAAMRADTERTVDGLTCLRDAVPDALEVVLHLAPLGRRQAERPRMTDPWAYVVGVAGLWFEPVETWAGWDAKPGQLLAWAELSALVAHDGRRDDLREWASSLTAIDRWKDLLRPCEMSPHPEMYHESWIDSDHKRPGWAERRNAWDTTRTMLSDAIAAVRSGTLTTGG